VQVARPSKIKPNSKIFWEEIMRWIHLVGILTFLNLPLSSLAQDKIAASDPTSTTTDSNASSAPAFKTFKEAYSAGNDALKDRKFSESASDYGAAEDLASGDKAKSQAANAQGWAYLKARKLEQAKKAFARSVEENADNKLALKNLGAVEYDLYQYGMGTEDDLKDAVKNLEASGENQEDLESAKAALSREEDYAEATPVEPDTSGMNFKALCALSDKLEEQGQTEQALKAMGKAAELANTLSGKAAAANRQGKLLLDARRPSKAESFFEEAVKYQPKDKVYLNNLGWNNWILYQSGKGEEPELKKAVEAFYQMNSADPSYHGDNLKMALDELKEVDPDAAKAYTVKDESTTDTNKAENDKSESSKEDNDSAGDSK
jgi:tetratricopeptide (TPR) repeat protein